MDIVLIAGLVDGSGLHDVPPELERLGHRHPATLPGTGRRRRPRRRTTTRRTRSSQRRRADGSPLVVGHSRRRRCAGGGDRRPDAATGAVLIGGFLMMLAGASATSSTPTATRCGSRWAPFAGRGLRRHVAELKRRWRRRPTRRPSASRRERCTDRRASPRRALTLVRPGFSLAQAQEWIDSATCPSWPIDGVGAVDLEFGHGRCSPSRPPGGAARRGDEALDPGGRTESRHRERGGTPRPGALSRGGAWARRPWWEVDGRAVGRLTASRGVDGVSGVTGRTT